MWRQVAEHGKGRRRCASCWRFLGGRGTFCRWFRSLAPLRSLVTSWPLPARPQWWPPSRKKASRPSTPEGPACLPPAYGNRCCCPMPKRRIARLGSRREPHAIANAPVPSWSSVMSGSRTSSSATRRTSASSSPRNASGFPMHPFSPPQVVRSCPRGWSRSRRTNCAWSTACRRTLAWRCCAGTWSWCPSRPAFAILGLRSHPRPTRCATSCPTYRWTRAHSRGWPRSPIASWCM